MLRKQVLKCCNLSFQRTLLEACIMFRQAEKKSNLCKHYFAIEFWRFKEVFLLLFLFFATAALFSQCFSNIFRVSNLFLLSQLLQMYICTHIANYSLRAEFTTPTFYSFFQNLKALFPVLNYGIILISYLPKIYRLFPTRVTQRSSWFMLHV